MYRPLLALRYLVSRPINLLGVAGVALGVWALVVVPSIFTGYLREVGRHLQSSTADLTLEGLPEDVPTEDLLAAVEADPGVAAAAPRIVWQGLLHPPAPPSHSRPPAQGLDELIADAPLVTLLGVDPERELRLSGLGTWLRRPPAELQVPDPDHPFTAAAASTEPDRPVVLISRQRLERDGFTRGGLAAITVDQLVGQGSNALSVAPPRRFVVGGCYESSFAAFDGLNVYVRDRDLAAMLGGNSSRPSQIAVRLRDGSDPATVGGRLEREIRNRYGAVARASTWAENNSAQLEAIRHQRGLLQLVLWVIVLVAGFVVYATQSMMVTEKTRDIGVLTALGADARGVASVFLACGGAVTGIGVLIGVVAGVLSAHQLDAFNNLLREIAGIDLFPVRIYNLRRVPYALEPGWIAAVAVIATTLGVLAAGLPAWRAARQDPLHSLRHE